MKKPKTKPAAKASADFITQAELRAVSEMYDIANDLAIELRRRIENGACVKRGCYSDRLENGASALSAERRHRENCTGLSLRGLSIEHKEATRA